MAWRAFATIEFRNFRWQTNFDEVSFVFYILYLSVLQAMLAFNKRDYILSTFMLSVLCLRKRIVIQIFTLSNYIILYTFRSATHRIIHMAI